MKAWNEILSNEHAVVTDQQIVEFKEAPNPSLHTVSNPATTDDLLVIPLIDRDFLQINGADTKKFLQGQVTCDVNQLSESNWFPGAICNPKGRMITSFTLFPLSADNLLMEMNPGLADITLEAIKKYSAFFKTQLDNASGKFCLIGLMGNSVNLKTVTEKLFNIPNLNPGELYHYQECLVISQDEARVKILVPTDKLDQLWQHCTSEGRPASNLQWKLADIQQGVGDVTLGTTNELIPQMINLQARGGISFKKGCYTGQEIVARMKYLGKLKRRMYRIQFQSDSVPEVAESCYSHENPNNQGLVISAVNAGDHIEALVVMTEQLAADKSIGFGEQAMRSFELLPLPYNLD